MVPRPRATESAEVVMACGDGHYRPRQVRKRGRLSDGTQSDLEVSVRGAGMPSPPTADSILDRKDTAVGAGEPQETVLFFPQLSEEVYRK